MFVFAEPKLKMTLKNLNICLVRKQFKVFNVARSVQASSDVSCSQCLLNRVLITHFQEILCSVAQ